MFGNQPGANTTEWGGHNTLVRFAERGEHAAWGTLLANSARDGDYDTPMNSFLARQAPRWHATQVGWTPDAAHWPTPAAGLHNDGESPDTFFSRKAHHANKEHPTQSGVPLTVAAKMASSGPRGVRLNPLFVEALMGWPFGWTDLSGDGCEPSVFPPAPRDVEGWRTFLERWPTAAPAVERDIPDRASRLRACGNGVVPQQASAAFREMFDALGLFVVRHPIFGEGRLEQSGEPLPPGAVLVRFKDKRRVVAKFSLLG